MRIKLDENLPLRLVEALSRLGHDIVSVPEEGLSGKDDHQVWSAAKTENRFLITQDLGVADIRRVQSEAPAGVLLIRLREPGRDALFHRVFSLFQPEKVETWSGCLVVATERKLRIRRLATR